MDYETIENTGTLAKGKKELLKYMDGEDLTLRQSVHAKCYECMGCFVDGKEDCKIEECPLYPWMPYNPNKIMSRRNLTDEQRAEVGERLKRARAIK